MKHIVIDARLYGPKHTGIGRYTKNLLLALKEQPNFSKYKFTLIVYQNTITEIKADLGDTYNYYPTKIKHYSFKEQLLLPFILSKLKPDLVHFTHFNKPIFYFGKSLITIHDLIKHFFKGPKNSTKTSLAYWPKYLFYRIFTNFSITHNPIIVPSNYWRDFIIKTYQISPQVITTTHEAVDPNFTQLKPLKTQLPKNYLIYTGNLYPHKNVEIILESLKLLPKMQLKIICARNFFSQKLEKTIKQNNLQNQVEFLGYIPDKEFINVYSQALALVHPSLMEGFSLTGLEAMSLNCPVISSNSSCLPEIYQDSVLYFNPKNPKDLANQINKLYKSKKLRNQMIILGQKQVAKYSWDSTASKTLSVYQKILAIEN